MNPKQQFRDRHLQGRLRDPPGKLERVAKKEGARDAPRQNAPVAKQRMNTFALHRSIRDTQVSRCVLTRTGHQRQQIPDPRPNRRSRPMNASGSQPPKGISSEPLRSGPSLQPALRGLACKAWLAGVGGYPGWRTQGSTIAAEKASRGPGAISGLGG